MTVFIHAEVAMYNASVGARVLAVSVMLVMPALPGAAPQEASPQAGKTITMAAETLRGYQTVQRNLTEAAEKMPEEHYGFKATPEVKPFGQLVAHVSLAQFGMCAALKGEDNPKKDEKEETARTKADAIALLKASSAYCDPLVSAMTDAAFTELTKLGPNQVAKGLIPVSVIAHGMEMHGTMAVYLRLKGIVPPSTERQKAMMQKKSQ
jgi:uncharacterized damage-inducible protein DinB